MSGYTTIDIDAPSGTERSIHERQVELAKIAGPSLFKLKAQLLDQGRTDTVLAATDDLSVRLKVYAEGGENELHAHPHEDHFFVVLKGAAEFHGPHDETVTVGAYEGIMLPKGNLYWFVARAGEPLVMLRVGSPNIDKQKGADRIDRAGAPMPGDSKANKTQPVKFRPGAWFGA